MVKKRLKNTYIRPGISYREKRGLSKTTHLLALIVASIAAALAFGLPVDPIKLTALDVEEADKAYIQVNLPLPELQSGEPAAIAPAAIAEEISHSVPEAGGPEATAGDPKVAAVEPVQTTAAKEPGQQQIQTTPAVALVEPPQPRPAYLHGIENLLLKKDLFEDEQHRVNFAKRLLNESDNSEDWQTTTVKPGDNLTEIFVRLGLKPEKLYSLMSNCDEAEDLEKVLPGQIFKIRTDDSGSLQELVLEIDKIRGTRIFRDGEVFKALDYKHDIEKRTATTYGMVDGSFYTSASRAGLPDKIIMQLTDIFSWDIDFSHDVHGGDAFTVVYEEDFFSGEKIGAGDILAVEYVNKGKPYRAIGFRNAKGKIYYYTPDGQGLKRMFMRNPVNFSRISSPFQMARWHPVLGKKRPHRGVDYAAAPGTPIKASGDGTVIHSASKGGYGKTVVIDHGRGYTTLYAHLSNYKRGLKAGKKVLQGQVIGYVGQTGLATGPHLHYEFRVNGVHKNPVTARLPGAEPIPAGQRQKFKRQARELTAQLDRYQQTRLALYQR